jgi:hypothetical protein
MQSHTSVLYVRVETMPEQFLLLFTIMKALFLSPPLSNPPHRSSPLRVASPSPGQTEALAGDDAIQKRLRRGAGCSIGCISKRFPSLLPWCSVMPVEWREPRKVRRATISTNKAASRGFPVRWICGDEFLLPAGHGGEGAERLIIPSSSSWGRCLWRLCILELLWSLVGDNLRQAIEVVVQRGRGRLGIPK